jgi:hypothetical protein
LDLFQQVSLPELNALPKRYTPVSALGFWEQYPVCLDIYQAKRGEPWAMPTLADITQTHTCIQPDRKESDYHFLVWQHSKAERRAADVTIYYDPIPTPPP